MSESGLRRSRGMVTGAVSVVALAWPWGAYGDVFHGHGLCSAALLVLLLAFGLSWLRNGRPNLPFDLFWPALLLMCCSGVIWAAGEREAALNVLGGGLAFLLALFGATNQALVFRALSLSALSAAAVAVLTVLAEYNYVFPTFFARQGGAVGAGPTALAEALLLFCWSFFMAIMLFLGCRRVLAKTVTWMLPLAALCCAAALFVLTRRLGEDWTAWSPNYGVLAFPALPILLLGLYLASRVAARMFVLAGPGIFSMRHCLGLFVLAFVLLLAFAGQIPSPGICFCLGLVAALGLPNTLRNTKALGFSWAGLLVIPVLAAHAVMLFPGDARDYVCRMHCIKEAEGIPAARDFLSLVLCRFPGESRARIELAKMALERGEFDAAVDSFLAAVRDRRASRVFDKPGLPGVDTFLAQLKAKTNTLPGICYERCLLGTGKESQAVATLKTRLKAGASLDINREPLQRALAGLLGSQKAAPLFSDWTAAELVAGLNLCGTYCASVQAPVEIPRRYLPAVLSARPLHDGRTVAVCYPGGQLGRSWCMPRCTGETPGEGESWWLDPVLDGETGEWYLPLAGAADVGFGDELRVSLVEDAKIDCGPRAGGWAVICLLP